MKILLVGLAVFSLTIAYSQDSWIQRENMSLARIGATGFAVNNMGYVGMGRSAALQYLKDLWMYDPNTDVWTQMNNYPGGGSYSLSVAVVGNDVYMGLGYDGSFAKTDWWKYNPLTDTYVQLASYPGLPRYGASAFVVGNKIFLIAGSKGGVPYYEDCYAYDIPTNTWSQIATFPGGLRNHTTTFAYDGKGYVTCGTVDLTLSANDLWEYNPVNNTWLQKASLPGQIRTAAAGFQIGPCFYVCTGLDIQTVFLTDLWEYNVLTNTWTARATFPGPARYFSVGFAVGGYGYLATGGDYTVVQSDLWQYTPPTISVKESGAAVPGSKFHLAPNPAGTSATVSFDHPAISASLQIIDLSGRILQHYEGIQGSVFELDCRTLSHGVYFVRYSDQNARPNVQRFVVQ